MAQLFINFAVLLVLLMAIIIFMIFAEPLFVCIRREYGGYMRRRKVKKNIKHSNSKR